MNRSEKIALLTNVLRQGDSPANRQHLQRVSENAPQCLIIIDDLDLPKGHIIADSDPVHFYDRGKKHLMSLAEAEQYIDTHRIGTFFILPAKC